MLKLIAPQSSHVRKLPHDADVVLYRRDDNDTIVKYYLCSVLPTPCCRYKQRNVNEKNNSTAYCCAWNYKNSPETYDVD